MKILVTAGNTQVPLDQVRCLTNFSTGRTGAAIALEAGRRGHDFVLLTSHPETLPEDLPSSSWEICAYRTFDDLQVWLEKHLLQDPPDAVVHCAAVSDHRAAGVYAPASGTAFREENRTWTAAAGSPRLEDRAAGKIKSDAEELWIRLVRTPKLIDRMRTDWNFRGVLVKFKLEVGLDDADLLQIAEQSRLQSAADWMVANTLEGAAEWAFLGPFPDGYRKLPRPDLPARLLDALEASVALRKR